MVVLVAAMKHIEMRVDNEWLVHYEGPDPTRMLCGLSHDEDDRYPYSDGTETNKRVNCDKCIEFRNHVLGKKSGQPVPPTL